MAPIKPNTLVLIITSILLLLNTTTASSRSTWFMISPVSDDTQSSDLISPTPANPLDLVADRTYKKDDDTAADWSRCWDAVNNVRSCSNDLIGYFLNGETDIDEECCSALEVIAKHCWTAVIGALGYSAEEVSLMEGYCRRMAAAPSTIAPSPAA